MTLRLLKSDSLLVPWIYPFKYLLHPKLKRWWCTKILGSRPAKLPENSKLWRARNYNHHPSCLTDLARLEFFYPHIARDHWITWRFRKIMASKVDERLPIIEELSPYPSIEHTKLIKNFCLLPLLIYYFHVPTIIINPKHFSRFLFFSFILQFPLRSFWS